MAVVNFEGVSKSIHADHKLQEFFKTWFGYLPPEPEMIDTAARERPFVSPLAWGYFSTYRWILMGSYMMAKALKIGVEDPAQFFAADRLKALVKAALPKRADIIDKVPPTQYYRFLDELQVLFLEEAQKMMRGEEQDRASVEQAAAIMAHASEVAKAEATKVNAEAGPEILTAKSMLSD